MRHPIVLALCLLLPGCVATTKVASYTDPGYVTANKFHHVIVMCGVATLAERQQAESIAVAELAKIGVRGTRAIDILPPTRNLSSEEVAEATSKVGADSVLIMRLGDRDVAHTYVPPTYHPGKTTSTVNFYGSQAYVTTYQSPGYTTGGYNIKKPRATYSAELYELKSGAMVWRGEGSSRGNAFASFEDLTLSAAREFVKTLRADGRI